MVKFKFLAHFPVDHLAHLLCDWWFHLCHRIVYICYFVASYLSSPWYNWFFFFFFLFFFFFFLLLLLLIIYSLLVFDTSFCWWSLTRVSKSLPISMALLSILVDLRKCCNLGGLDSSSDFQFLEVFFTGLWGVSQAHQLQVISPPPPCSTDFLVLWQSPSLSLSFRFFYFHSVIHRNWKIN